MKVYAIKNDKGQYQTPDIDYISEIWLADIFNDYEVAKHYCRSDCNVVECELIEKNELADHDKKVRAEVVAEIRDIAGDYWVECEDYDSIIKESKDILIMNNEDLEEILDSVLGGEE